MLFIATNKILAIALFAISTTASAAAGSDKPPRFLTVPVLGLLVPLDRINAEPFPEKIRVKCPTTSETILSWAGESTNTPSKELCSR